MSRPSLRRVTAVGHLVALALLVSACAEPPQPLIIGHRGSPWDVAENSIAGFKLAYEQGADGIELDVQLTRDGKIIVMHDETLDRTTGCKGEVLARTLADLSACQLENGEPIRSLEDVLKLIGGHLDPIFVEIKTPEDRALPQVQLEAYTDAVVAVVKASGHTDRVVMISYDEAVLQRLSTQQGIVAGWDDTEGGGVAKAKRWGLPWVLMPARSVDATLAAVAAGLQQQIAVYQVNTPAQFLEAQAAGVDAIMADSIHTICSLAGRRPRDAPSWGP